MNRKCKWRLSFAESRSGCAVCWRHSIPPEILEPVRRQRGVDRRARDRPMPEPPLDRPSVVPLVGEGVAVDMARHVETRVLPLARTGVFAQCQSDFLSVARGWRGTHSSRRLGVYRPLRLGREKSVPVLAQRTSVRQNRPEEGQPNLASESSPQRLLIINHLGLAQKLRPSFAYAIAAGTSHELLCESLGRLFATT
jgi:hypothetical protein